MATNTYVRRSRIAAPADVVCDWHRRPGALERLTPPWENVEVLSRSGGIDQSGSRVTLRIRTGPFRRPWISEHRDYVKGRQFRDIQIQGPFRSWTHTHRFEPIDADSSVLEDRIEYELPLGWLGRLLDRTFVRMQLERMFHYRHETTAHDLESHVRPQPSPPLKILVSGAGGFIGNALVPFLTTGGHEVLRLSRGDGKQDDKVVQWDPVRREIDRSTLNGVHAVVHLVGDNSGTDGTRFLCESLAKLPTPPSVLVRACTIGQDGEQGDEFLQATRHHGSEDFSSEVRRGWEEATEPAREKGVRVVNLGVGKVLSPVGGVLAKMLPLFKLGFGGLVNSGDRPVDWVSLDDFVGLTLFVLRQDQLEGPVHAVAPHPVTSRELTMTLGRILARPTARVLPAFAARWVWGEMANELIPSRARVTPSKLLEAGYRFRHPSLETALRHMLGKTGDDV